MNKRLNFDWLHFSDSHIEVIRLHENELELLARNVSVVDVEKHVEVGKYEKLSLKFFGVGKSVRHLIPYASDMKDSEFLAPIDICDINKKSRNKKRFEFEGILVEPFSWIESWVIECDKVEAIDIDGSIFEVDRELQC